MLINHGDMSFIAEVNAAAAYAQADDIIDVKWAVR